MNSCTHVYARDVTDDVHVLIHSSNSNIDNDMCTPQLSSSVILL